MKDSRSLYISLNVGTLEHLVTWKEEDRDQSKEIQDRWQGTLLKTCPSPSCKARRPQVVRFEDISSMRIPHSEIMCNLNPTSPRCSIQLFCFCPSWRYSHLLVRKSTAVFWMVWSNMFSIIYWSIQNVPIGIPMTLPAGLQHTSNWAHLWQDGFAANAEPYGSFINPDATQAPACLLPQASCCAKDMKYHEIICKSRMDPKKR